MNRHSRVPPAEANQAVQPRKRRRPPGSKNKPKVQYLSNKEEDYYALAVKLRNDGVISVPGAPFEASDHKEIDDLVGRGVFSFELFDPTLHGGYRIFKSRMVREVKGKTMVPYEKSRPRCSRGQGAKIEIIDPKAANRAQKYMEQRARGAYIASICQPEASFDLSAAAQIQQPKDTEYVKLNRRLQWQSESIQRGLRYVPLDLATAKLVVFTDGSFANNQDLSSQLGYLLILANESSRQDSTFDIRGNVIHWSSTKCKRVTRSVLASETYGMVSGVDIAIAILTTLKIITGRLGLPPIPLIVCTDSYSLYECLVKLGTTAEKRLMIDIMALRQSYERREITEIRWINGEDNPADAFTKATPNRALERFIESNKLSIRVEGSVQRPTE
ncbi:conserved hypothetical protein [Pyrenophora tritici-repentis Pt-1C-BFP]|uniref:Polyprotein n=1 Tax=Pyrenophora tritici-repentis (strain Pt-1C-BFP) TaxID=426418 RepID=B2WJS2_PYRTR|nr:uncharacterized protein PTRG_10419 [Pyrenophora tritici-repentis Pt-1C-BFP]EDU43469.1 conserved hypothetical protein [Pyrenophora tritici-repentis Pt-1C-BFP]